MVWCEVESFESGERRRAQRSSSRRSHIGKQRRTTMRRKCCVPSCNSGIKCSVCQVSLSYFKIPRDQSMIKKWEQALGLRDQRLQLRDRVCSSHFKRSDVLTKRFVSLKRPSTNSKMILEISKLERDTIPSSIRQEITPCVHSRENKRSSIKSCTKLSRSESMSVGSEPASSQSDDSDESSSVDRPKEERETQLTRKDYRTVVKSVENRSKRRQIRALGTLRLKWLGKKKKLEKHINLLEDKIRDLNYEREEIASFDSD